MGYGSLLGAGAGAGLGFALGGPMGAGLGMAAGSAIGGAADGAFSSPGRVDAPQITPDSAQYGVGGAAFTNQRDQLQQNADDALGRTAPVVNQNRANQDIAFADQTRNQQSAFGQTLLDAANGNAPSAAELQMREGARQAALMGAQQAASSRGGAENYALAQRQAVNDASLGAAQANAQAAQLRAQEMAQNRGMYANYLTGMRGQDMGMRGMDISQQGLLAQNEMQQRQLNDARSQNQTGDMLGMQAQQQSTALGINQANLGAQQGTLGINAQRQTAAQQQSQAMTGSLVGAGASLGAAGIASSGGGGTAPAGPPKPDPNNPYGL